MTVKRQHIWCFELVVSPPDRRPVDRKSLRSSEASPVLTVFLGDGSAEAILTLSYLERLKSPIAHPMCTTTGSYKVSRPLLLLYV